MCGRYALTVDPAELKEAFPGVELPVEQELGPRYNVAPTQPVPVVANNNAHRIEMFRWGLVPSWAKDLAAGNRMINARAESLAEKPSFRTAFRRRRCLVLADGFYEWQTDPDARAKTPMFIRLKSGKPFAFAGLWEVWKSPEDELVRSCAIITTSANEVVKPIHDRMPVILDPRDYAAWLQPEEVETAELASLLRPYPASEMTTYEVSRTVNDPRADVPECIVPLAGRRKRTAQAA